MSNIPVEICTPVGFEGSQYSARGSQRSIWIRAGPNKYFRDLDRNVFVGIQRSNLVKKPGNIIGHRSEITTLALIKSIITFEILLHCLATSSGNKILIKVMGIVVAGV
jgi:hypothetical protein